MVKFHSLSNTILVNLGLGKAHVVLQLERGLVVNFAGNKLDAKLVLDGEDGVSFEVFAVFVEYLRRQRLVAVGFDLEGLDCGCISDGAYHEVDMCGPIDLTIHKLEKLSSRAILGDLRC